MPHTHHKHVHHSHLHKTHHDDHVRESILASDDALDEALHEREPEMINFSPSCTEAGHHLPNCECTNREPFHT